ncbi:MAG TPA: 50S ribosomal protein L25 [Candidatus Paceibacterota bacterium]|nr:50S ribosomal protein L25 [Candidatus Paceibacterota bacterium]
MNTIHAETRDASASLKKLRSTGKIPAVFYGKKEASTPISIPAAEFAKIWKEAGESSVITIERSEGTVEALIKDVDIDPVTGLPRHADFYVFEKGHALEIKVPLTFEGEAPAEKEGGIVVKVLHELDIKAQPQNLPHEIIVDLSVLAKIDDQITAADLKLPAGVELVQDPEDVVALATLPKEEVEEAPVDLESIEVEAKGKEAKEGEEPAVAEE